MSLRQTLAPTSSNWVVPAVIASAGEQAAPRYIEFFTANIRNKNTRLAYAKAIGDFLGWCEHNQLSLKDLTPVMVAAYIESMCETHSAPTVKQHLAAIRMLFDWFVVGQVISINPAASVRGPKHVVKKGKTFVLSADQARELLNSIDTNSVCVRRTAPLPGAGRRWGRWMERDKVGKQGEVGVADLGKSLRSVVYLGRIAGGVG